MDSGAIGIKLADNKFFPIMKTGVEGSKTLELTTVRENQTSVQINLYRSKDSSPDQTIDNAEYIGTLFIEDIMEKPAGEPTVELTIRINEENDLAAEAMDLDSGSRQSLNVSLKTIDQNSFTDLPDFDITDFESNAFASKSDLKTGDFSVEEDFTPASFPEENTFGETSFTDNSFDESKTVDFDNVQSSPVPDGLYDSSGVKSEKDRKGIFLPAWLCVLILILGIAALSAALIFAWKLFFADKSVKENKTSVVVEKTEPAPVEPQQQTPPVAEETTPPPVSEPEPVVEEVEPEPPREPEPAPATENVFYHIQWGDTLWDLAETYYRNPWQYKYIARYNAIKNPDLIIAGRYLVIPAE